MAAQSESKRPRPRTEISSSFWVNCDTHREQQTTLPLLLVLMVTHAVEKPTTPTLAGIDQPPSITPAKCPLSLLDLQVENLFGMNKYTRCDRDDIIPLQRRQLGRSRCRMVAPCRRRKQQNFP